MNRFKFINSGHASLHTFDVTSGLIVDFKNDYSGNDNECYYCCYAYDYDMNFTSDCQNND